MQPTLLADNLPVGSILTSVKCFKWQLLVRKSDLPICASFPSRFLPLPDLRMLSLGGDWSHSVDSWAQDAAFSFQVAFPSLCFPFFSSKASTIQDTYYQCLADRPGVDIALDSRLPIPSSPMLPMSGLPSPSRIWGNRGVSPFQAGPQISLGPPGVPFHFSMPAVWCSDVW